MKGNLIFIIALLIILTGCENKLDSNEESMSKYNPIFLGANLNGMAYSRAYQEEGSVEEGTFTITYFNFDREYETGTVTFVNGVGFGKKPTDGSHNDLGWDDVSSDVVNGDTYTFYMDNLLDGGNSQSVEIDPLTTPFKAAVFDKEEGSNDLLWGKLTDVKRSNSPLIFDLYHVMARFSLRVYVDNSYIGSKIYPETSSISNVFQSPVSFDRITGTLGLQEMPDENDFKLVDNPDIWKRVEKEIIEDGVKSTEIYFESPDYVIPPQQFLQNQRPRLTVTVNDGNGKHTNFSGLLPLSMVITDENGNISPWQMEFLRGYKLIMNVRVSNNPIYMQFMPITILPWYDKGTYTIRGSQAAVQDEDGLKKLIDTYNAGTENEFYKWGYKSDGKWIFNIFQNISISATDFKGRMKEKENLPYGFNLHSAVVDVALSESSNALLSGVEGAQALTDLLNKGILPTASE